MNAHLVFNGNTATTKHFQKHLALAKYNQASESYMKS